MTVVVTVLLLAVAVAVIGWLSWTARRLDRLHRQCERSAAALAQALDSRREQALATAARPGLDPPTAVLLIDAASFDADPVHAGSEGGVRGHWQRESELSQVLRTVWPVGSLDTSEDDTGDGGHVRESLAAAATRVTLARRIHNDQVATCLALRGRRRVRWFRLAGHAPAPLMVDFDDAPPT